MAVALREPVGGLRRFLLVPPLRWNLFPFDEHPTAAELARRLTTAPDRQRSCRGS